MRRGARCWRAARAAAPPTPRSAGPMRVRLAVRLEERLAQVNQVALGLRLARAPHVLDRRWSTPANGSLPRTTTWSARIAAYSSGKTSSVRSSSSRRRASAGRRCRAGASARCSGRHATRSRNASVVDDRAANGPSRRRGCRRRRRAPAAARRRRSSRSRASGVDGASAATAEKMRHPVDYSRGVTIELVAHAAAHVQHRMLRRRHRTAEPARRAEVQPVARPSTRSSRCSTAAGARACCATSSACCRRATCSSARSRSRATSARRGACCSRGCRRSSTTRLGGHTGGNLLLSMMQQYSGDFLAAVDGLRGAARLRRPGLAGQHRAGERLRRVPRRHAHPRRSRSGRRADRAGTASRGCGSSRRCRSCRPRPRRSPVRRGGRSVPAASTRA